MAARTGVEPAYTRVKGVCVNRFTNGPFLSLITFNSKPNDN